MQKIFFIQFFVFISSFAFTQTIVRLDNSRITAQQLNDKIDQLMKDASVSGMAISVFNDGRPVYHKILQKLKWYWPVLMIEPLKQH